jgi:hypothetical protein
MEPTEEISLPGWKPRTAAMDGMGLCETYCHSSFYNKMHYFVMICGHFIKVCGYFDNII